MHTNEHPVAIRAGARPAFIACLLLVFGTVSGCSESDTTERFADTYADILVVRSRQLDSLTARAKIDSVLSAHGYSRESFRGTFEQLMHDPKAYTSVLDSARARAQRRIPMP